MKNIEMQIIFSSDGNCFVGADASYHIYVKLFEVIKRRKPFIQEGATIRGMDHEIKRFIDYIETFGPVIRTARAFEHCCKLSGVALLKEIA